VLPPLAVETVGRDIGDLVYERLADLAAGAAPIDTTAYRPRLASQWERVDSLTWRFHLRPGARWSDGQSVTSDDVVFSFAAFSDSMLDSPARSYLAGKVQATAEGASTVLIRFNEPGPEQLYDATYHVRVIPKHIWSGTPKSVWGADTSVGRLVGSGPYRVTRWQRGQSLSLEAIPTAARRANIPQLIWRFAPDPDAALNLVLSHEADLLEAVGSPDRASRLAGDTALAAIAYPSAAYGFLGYQIDGPGREGKPHPILGDRVVRQALNQAVDRAGIAKATFGPETKSPPGPMSQLLWIWDDGVHTLSYDTAAAARLLDGAGWRRGKDGIRGRNGRLLAFDLLIPSTSVTRRRLAEVLQERWRALGAKVSIVAVDFPEFQKRLDAGQFDSYIGAWLDEPTPRGLADQWTRSGWGALNYGHYANPRFDSLFSRALSMKDIGLARAAWREAMDTLNQDAPALFLYAPSNVAAVARRVKNPKIDPYSWLADLPEWSLAPGAAQ
jgi:peptide/nickel transport system substrate-binding protein